MNNVYRFAIQFGGRIMRFEDFLNEYEKECSSFRDDAWSSILLRKISHLSANDKRFILDKLLYMVKERRGDWYVVLDALEEYGTERHIQALIDSQRNPDLRSGFVVKVFAKRDVAVDIIRDYLREGEIDSSWRYVVKNLSDQQNQLLTHLTGILTQVMISGSILRHF